MLEAHPNRHDLVYCWASVADGGPASNQHCFHDYLAITIRRSCIGLMLGQRHRRWPSIDPALGERVSFTRYADMYPQIDLFLIFLPFPGVILPIYYSVHTNVLITGIDFQSLIYSGKICLMSTINPLPASDGYIIS